jgi:CO/xanthine dehydrogenase FAD-binding subunit
LFAAEPPDSTFAAGATYLMWRAAHGEPLPGQVVSLHRIPGHDDVSDGSIGALASLRRIERGPSRGAQRALTMAASVTAGPAVRTLATLGGNLASGFPQADLVPALLALDSQVEFDDGSCRSAVDIVEDGLETARLITRVSHQLIGDGWSGASVKLCRRGMDLSVGLASTVLRVQGDEVVEARVAVGSLHYRPTRLPAIESALVGADTGPETLREVVDVIGVTGRKFAADSHASATYRARIAAPLVHRALTLAGRLGADGIPGPMEAYA